MALDDDLFDKSSLEIFIDEANESIEALEVGLLALEDNPDDADVLDEVFRQAHTLKGNAGFLGLDRLNLFAHAMEDVLESIRQGEFAFTSEAASALLAAVDCLRHLVACAAEDRPPDQELVAEVEGRLKALVENPPPAATEVGPEAEIGPPTEHWVGEAGGGERILVIHDVAVIRKIVENYIVAAEMDEVELESVASAQAGAKRLDEKKFDVVLCGLQMSGMDGIAVHERMLASEINKETSFVLLTSTDTEEQRQRLARHGIDHVLAMPFTPQQLKGIIQKVYNPLRRRAYQRFAIPGATAVVTVQDLDLPAEVLNVSLNGVLCRFDYPAAQPNLMPACRMKIVLPPAYAQGDAAGITARLVRVVVQNWGPDDTPQKMRAGWEFVKLPEPAREVLGLTLDKARQELTAAEREAGLTSGRAP